MLVAFWQTLVKIVAVFQHKRQRTIFFSRFVHNLKTPTRTVHALHYRMQMTTHKRHTAFQKLLQSSQTSRNNKKLSKQVLVMINHIWQTHKLTRYRSKQFSYRTFLYRGETQKFTRITSLRADFIHSQSEIKEILDPEKHTFSIKSEHRST